MIFHDILMAWKFMGDFILMATLLKGHAKCAKNLMEFQSVLLVIRATTKDVLFLKINKSKRRKCLMRLT